jgi:hypothetical protein
LSTGTEAVRYCPDPFFLEELVAAVAESAVCSLLLFDLLRVASVTQRDFIQDHASSQGSSHLKIN